MYSSIKLDLAQPKMAGIVNLTHHKFSPEWYFPNSALTEIFMILLSYRRFGWNCDLQKLSQVDIVLLNGIL